MAKQTLHRCSESTRSTWFWPVTGMESRVRRSTHREPSSRHCKSTAVTAGVWLKIIFSTRSVDSASAVIEWRPKPRCLPACSNLTHYSRPRNKWPISMNSFMSIRFLLLLPFFMVDFILALGHWLLLCFFFLEDDEQASGWRTTFAATALRRW